MNAISERLKSHNLKVTPQRLAIYNMLSNTTTHPSADTIYKAIEKEHPTMSLATIYKTLDSFKECGLVQELNVCEDCFRYDAKTEPHPHIICVSCRRVVDLPIVNGLESLRKSVAEQTDFSVYGEQLYFYGKCKVCQ